MRKIIFQYEHNTKIQPIDWENTDITADDIHIKFMSLKEIYDTMTGLMEFMSWANLTTIYNWAEEMSKDKIRCKDCRWFNTDGCAIEIVDDEDKPKENDYCSFAELRGEE